MLTIEKISLSGFKNYDSLELNFASGLNCFVGKNGSGKTNLLDAIYFLAFTKSAFNYSDNQLIKKGSDLFFLSGNFKLGEQSHFVSARFINSKKKEFNFDKKTYDKLTEHIGRLPLVLISPYDTDLIRDGSEMRRKFLDGMLSQLYPDYLEKILQYKQILKHRNAILKHYTETKNIDFKLLEVLTEQMEPLNESIFKYRSEFLEHYIKVFKETYHELSDGAEKSHIVYLSEMGKIPLKELQKSNIQKDLDSGRSNIGIHKDDLLLLINGMNLSKFGSQGQQKTFIIALKLAQYKIIEEFKQFKPILMIDDLFDRIDMDRISKLKDMINQKRFGQIFITDTDIERIKKLNIPQMAVYDVEGGVVENLQF